MRRALSIMEIALLGALVCIISIAGFATFNNLKIGLTKMSTTNKAETTGTLAYEDDGPPVNIDGCVKNTKNLCKVYTDDKGNRYVFIETTGTAGQTWIQYLAEGDTISTTEGCIGQLATSPAAICYNAQGKQVKCVERDSLGRPIKIVIGEGDDAVWVPVHPPARGGDDGEGYLLPDGYLPAQK